MKGMNPERYAVIDVVKLPGRRTAYLQKAVRADEPFPFCAYIAGNGHYFKTEDKMREYVSCRCRKR